MKFSGHDNSACLRGIVERRVGARASTSAKCLQMSLWGGCRLTGFADAVPCLIGAGQEQRGIAVSRQDAPKRVPVAYGARKPKRLQDILIYSPCISRYKILTFDTKG